MVHDVNNGWSVLWVELEHGLEEILKVVREESFLAWLVLGVDLPEDISSVGSQTLVEWVLWLSGGERWMLGDHDEQDDGSSEDIHRFSFVWHFKVDFWSHVVQSSKLGMEHTGSISSLDWSSEPEVSNLKSILVVKQEILWLQISVSDSCLMAVVETLHELFHVEPGKWLIEPSRNSDEIEEFSTACKLKDDVRDLSCLSTALGVRFNTILELVDDVGMLDFRHGLNLSHEELLGLCVKVVVHDLNSNFSIVLSVESELDLAAGT